MKASELMTRDVKTIEENARCDEVARIMWEHDVGSVPVCDARGTLVGIVTDRDICMCAYTKGRALHELSVGEAMARELVCCKEDDDVRHVEELMQAHQVRRIPVEDAQGRCCGIIAMADIARRRGTFAAGAEVTESEIATTLDAVSQPHVH
jgi:CBS domain-containing protein